MTEQERKRYNELTVLMSQYDYYFTDDELNEFERLDAMHQSEYRKRNEPLIKEYFEKNICNKSISDIDVSILSFYSDWHKDVFGYRPVPTNSFNMEDR